MKPVLRMHTYCVGHICDLACEPCFSFEGLMSHIKVPQNLTRAIALVTPDQGCWLRQ